MNENANNLIVEPIYLHQYSYITLPPTDLTFRFSNLSYCQITSINRPQDCKCTDKCLTTIETTNYPCLYGDELITCTPTTRNMSESKTTYDDKGFPHISCFEYEIIHYSDAEPNSSVSENSDGPLKHFLKNNYKWLIPLIITIILIIFITIILIILILIIFVCVILPCFFKHILPRLIKPI